MRKISYHEAAEAELLTEVGYLELRRDGLGRRFLAEVRRAENHMARFPNLLRKSAQVYENAS